MLHQAAYNLPKRSPKRRQMASIIGNLIERDQRIIGFYETVVEEYICLVLAKLQDEEG
jgi:hypothetical protein